MPHDRDGKPIEIGDRVENEHTGTSGVVVEIEDGCVVTYVGNRESYRIRASDLCRV